MNEESENNIRENNLNIHDWNVERLNMLKNVNYLNYVLKIKLK